MAAISNERIDEALTLLRTAGEAQSRRILEELVAEAQANATPEPLPPLDEDGLSGTITTDEARDDEPAPTFIPDEPAPAKRTRRHK